MQGLVKNCCGNSLPVPCYECPTLSCKRWREDSTSLIRRSTSRRGSASRPSRRASSGQATVMTPASSTIPETECPRWPGQHILEIIHALTFFIHFHENALHEGQGFHGVERLGQINIRPLGVTDKHVFILRLGSEHDNLELSG